MLLVDDDPVAGLLIQKMIHKIDGSVNCHQYNNGEEGLQKINLDSFHTFHLYILTSSTD